MEFRARAGALKGCRTGGLGDIMRGLSAYGVKYRFLPDQTRAQASKRMSNAKSDKVFAIETDFGAWPTKAKCDYGKDFDGYHMVGVAPGAVTPKKGTNKGKTFLRTMDPLKCRKLKLVRRRGVLNAAIEYNNEHVEVPNTIDMLAVVTRPRRK
jgi:hypothetical protein